MYDFDPKKDYYKMLWVSEDANKDDIKKAFKKLAVKYHPDKKGGNKEKFQEINEAHQILSDEKKRQQYDMMKKWWMGGFWGAWWFWGADLGGFGGGSNFDFDLWDVVGSIFGWGWWGRSRVRKGDDIKHALEINFEESYLGVEKKIEYTRLESVKWATKKTCTGCNGRGAKVQQVQTPFGTMQTEAACRECNGTGNLYFKDGRELPNGWLEHHKETLTVKIPANIKDGVYIKYPGKGNAGIGDTPAWDLYIQIRIKKSRIFKRKGNDLYVKISLTIYDIVLWWTTETPHPEWKLKIKIPKWTQIGELIKISGKWFGETGIFSSKGNMYLEPEISIPKRLSKKQEKLWKELRGEK